LFLNEKRDPEAQVMLPGSEPVRYVLELLFDAKTRNENPQESAAGRAQGARRSLLELLLNEETRKRGFDKAHGPARTSP
tara:strand:+ start:80 stop:316 length:237 start_codon:yes stop_codon:yes gene_type:complete